MQSQDGRGGAHSGGVEPAKTVEEQSSLIRSKVSEELTTIRLWTTAKVREVLISIGLSSLAERLQGMRVDMVARASMRKGIFY